MSVLLNKQLDSQDVIDIRKRYFHDDVRVAKLVERYEVSRSSIYKILKGKRFEDVGGPTQKELAKEKRRFDDDTIVAIRKAYFNDEQPTHKILETYDLNDSTLYPILKGERYKDVGGPTQEELFPRNRKFSNKEIVKIRKSYKDTDITLTELANEYGVSHVMMNRIVRGENYQDCGGPVKTTTWVSDVTSEEASYD